MKLVLKRDGVIGEREFQPGEELQVGRNVKWNVAQTVGATEIGRLIVKNMIKNKRR